VKKKKITYHKRKSKTRVDGPGTGGRAPTLGIKSTKGQATAQTPEQSHMGKREPHATRRIKHGIERFYRKKSEWSRDLRGVESPKRRLKKYVKKRTRKTGSKKRANKAQGEKRELQWGGASKEGGKREVQTPENGGRARLDSGQRHCGKF